MYQQAEIARRVFLEQRMNGNSLTFASACGLDKGKKPFLDLQSHLLAFLYLEIVSFYPVCVTIRTPSIEFLLLCST